MERLAWERCERENAANCVGQDQEDTLTGSARALPHTAKALWPVALQMEARSVFFLLSPPQPGTPAILAFAKAHAAALIVPVKLDRIKRHTHASLH